MVNVSIFLICFLCFTQFSSISGEKKVSLALYYESLCPYCSNFIVNYLPKIFKNGMIDIVDLKLVPWGNTKLLPNNTFKCQHGKAECFLDIVEACAIDAWPDLNEHFPFIYCVESLVYHRNYTQWETCFEKLNLKKKLVTNCVVNGRGKKTKSIKIYQIKYIQLSFQQFHANMVEGNFVEVGRDHMRWVQEPASKSKFESSRDH